MCGTTRTPHSYFPWRLDQPTHKSCQSTLIFFFSTVFLMQKFGSWPSFSQALGAGMGWGYTATTLPCPSFCPAVLCAVCRHAPDARSALAIFGLRLATAVSCHTGDTHTAHFVRLSALLLASCLDFRSKQGRKQKKKKRTTHTQKKPLPNPPTFAHYGWE